MKDTIKIAIAVAIVTIATMMIAMVVRGYVAVGSEIAVPVVFAVMIIRKENNYDKWEKRRRSNR